jgi:uncharacterized protein
VTDVFTIPSTWAFGLPLLGAVLSASLVGSVHCAGMCGPLVVVYSAAGSRSRGWISHVAYHGGRALSYIGVGALFGVLGSAVDVAGKAAGVFYLAALLSGALVMLFGISVLFPALRIPSPTLRHFAPKLVQLGRKRSTARASLLGLLTPFLPCGWLYAFALTAAGTGSGARGALVMAAFWLGTVPALLGVGTIAHSLSQKVRARIPIVTGVALLMMGTLGVFYRMTLPLPQASSPSTHEVSCH